MAIKGVTLFGVCFMVWDTQNGIGKTGDSLNLSMRVIRNGIEGVPQNSPAEVDATNCPGLYRIDLTSNEMFADIVCLQGKSSTANTAVIPVEITTSAS